MRNAITVISSMATKHLLADLATVFERQTGIAVTVHSMGGLDAAKAVRAGSTADIVILAAPAITLLAQDGYVAPDGITAVAVSKMALAVPAGCALPDISDGAKVRSAMLAAPGVAYSTGPSGDHLKRLWSQWQIDAAMADRAVLAPPGVPVASLLADGSATLGVQQTSELIGQPGVTVVGPLPEDIQLLTIFTAGQIQPHRQPALPAAFIRFAASAENTEIKWQYGMDQPEPHP